VETFEAVVPEADRASVALFVSFDVRDGWLTDRLSGGDPEVKRNLSPLAALGASGRQDDAGVQHLLVRLTTD
jgi:hypothetical protein